MKDGLPSKEKAEINATESRICNQNWKIGEDL